MTRFFAIAISLFFGSLTSCQSGKTRATSPQESKSALATTMLINLKTTDRISSNNYAEMVLDDDGNSYVASFYKGLDGQDYLYLAKHDTLGELVWEMGSTSVGRALAIAIDDQNRIRVLGYFSKDLRLQEFDLRVDGDQAFMAFISADGAVIDVKLFDGNVIPLNICINEKGETLVWGQMSGIMAIDKVEMNAGHDNQTGFLAYFDANGFCKWIKPFSGEVAKIRSSQNVFYITGQIHEKLMYGETTLSTLSALDNDGFIMKLEPKSNQYWLRQFGQKGILKEGYRTLERGSDLAVLESGELLVLGLVNDHEDVVKPDAFIFQYDLNGSLVKQTRLMKGVSGSILTMAKDDDENLWITANASDSLTVFNKVYGLNNEDNAVILVLDRALQFKSIEILDHGQNTAIRTSTFRNQTYGAVGHFKSHMRIGSDSVSGSDRHNLFMYVNR